MTWLGRVKTTALAAWAAAGADALLIGGACLVAHGAWLVYEPAGFIVGGSMLMAVGWLLSRVA